MPRGRFGHALGCLDVCLGEGLPVNELELGKAKGDEGAEALGFFGDGVIFEGHVLQLGQVAQLTEDLSFKVVRGDIDEVVAEVEDAQRFGAAEVVPAGGDSVAGQVDVDQLLALGHVEESAQLVALQRQILQRHQASDGDAGQQVVVDHQALQLGEVADLVQFAEAVGREVDGRNHVADVHQKGVRLDLVERL